jgi:hypothetical protein
MNRQSYDWWTYECPQCGWRAISEFTVNTQQIIAMTLVKLHLKKHEGKT